MDPYRCKQARGPLDAVATAPPSRSLTNRALVLAALADGRSVLDNVLLAEDTRLMIDALRTLGFSITLDESDCRAEVTGGGGFIPESEADLFCGNSGTTLRFLTAVAALGLGGRYRIDGTPRLRRRPVGGLTEALQTLGAGIEFPDEPGFPPLVVHANGLRGGGVRFDEPPSSQMVSALLMVAPHAGRDVLIEATGPIPSRPYVAMTMQMMERFGISIIEDAERDGSSMRFIVESGQRYRSRNVAVEADATNAMYFLAAPAVAGGQVTVPNLAAATAQGDVRFVDILEKMGCCVEWGVDGLTVRGPASGSKLRGIDADLCDMPDSAQTLAVLALFADGPTTIRNVANLRIKETDRISALRNELQKLGAVIEERPDGLRIQPPTTPTPAVVETYDDHRMAMSFALAGLALPGLAIAEPQCVAKTFPDFFERFESMLT